MDELTTAVSDIAETIIDLKKVVAESSSDLNMSLKSVHRELYNIRVTLSGIYLHMVSSQDRKVAEHVKHKINEITDYIMNR